LITQLATEFAGIATWYDANDVSARRTVLFFFFSSQELLRLFWFFQVDRIWAGKENPDLGLGWRSIRMTTWRAELAAKAGSAQSQTNRRQQHERAVVQSVTGDLIVRRRSLHARDNSYIYQLMDGKSGSWI